MNPQQNSSFRIDETKIKLEASLKDDFKQCDKISISNKIKQEHISEDEPGIVDTKHENIKTLNEIEQEIKQEPFIEDIKYEMKQEIDIELMEYETQNYKCNKCEFTTTFFSSFEVHIDQCNKTNKRLNKKSKFITKEKPSCEICGKTFTSIRGLRKHMKLHTDSEPHDCIVCGKSFVCVAYLRAHTLTHRTVKLFSCNICNRRFARKPFLQSHMKTHTRWEPFGCEACKEAFYVASDLSKNLDTRIKTLECKTCGKVYSSD